MDGLLSDVFVPRWKRYIIGSVLTFYATGVVLLLGLRPEAFEPKSGGGWGFAARWVDANGAVGSWTLGLALPAVVVGTCVVLNAFSAVLFALLAGQIVPAGVPGRWLLERLRARQKAAVDRLNKRQGKLRRQDINERSVQVRRIRVATARRDYPFTEDKAGHESLLRQLDPTRIGNLMSSAARRIEDSHGLHPGTSWSNLIEVLPEQTRVRVEEFDLIVMWRAQQLALALATVLWAPLVALAHVPAWARVGLVAGYLVGVACVIRITHVRLINSVRGYFDLMEGLFRLHWPLLYRALGLELPESTDQEVARGHELTKLLESRRRQSVKFAWPSG